MKFSLYNNGIGNTIPDKEIDINEFIELLKQDSNIIQEVRKAKDKSEQHRLKKKLSYVTIAGTFNKRSKKQLKKSSGFACFDFDDIEDLEPIKEQLTKDEYTHLLFVSPSNKGLKCIVKIPPVKDDEEYKQYWDSIADYYNLECNDEKNKDISRACYMSVDKKPFYNKGSKIYVKKFEGVRIKNKTPGKKDNKDYTPKPNNSNNFIDKLKSRISMESILSHFGVDTSMNPTNCIFHNCSQRCLGFNSETAHCFDTDCSGEDSWNIISFVKKKNNMSSGEAIKWLAEFGGMQEEYEKQKQQYLNKDKKPMGWACSVNIKRLAERYDLTKCPKCNEDFIFNELGNYKCSKCGDFGGLKMFALMCYKKRLEVVQ